MCLRFVTTIKLSAVAKTKNDPHPLAPALAFRYHCYGRWALTFVQYRWNHRKSIPNRILSRSQMASSPPYVSTPGWQPTTIEAMFDSPGPSYQGHISPSPHDSIDISKIVAANDFDLHKVFEDVSGMETINYFKPENSLLSAYGRL